MTDTTGSGDGDPGARVYNFPRIGFTLTPPTTPPAVPGTPDTTPPADPVPDGPRAGRRSPLDLLAALPDPGILTPALPAPPHTPAPGMVPDTFRSEPAGDLLGPRLGALGLAATLAVAVAALRGTHTVLSTWWANRQARYAEGAALREARAKHAAAMEQIGHKAAQDRAKQSRKAVPSSAEFGRKTLGSRSGSGSGSGRGGSSGGGGGRSNGTKKPGSGSSSSRTHGPASKGRGNSGAGGGLRTKRPGNGNGSGGSGGRLKPKKHDTPRTPKPKSPHSGTQHGSRTGLDKHRTNAQHNGKGGGGGRGGKGRSLTDALAHDTSKAARKRLKQRRRHPDNPVLWNDRNTKSPLAKKRPRKTPDTVTKTPKTIRKQTPGGGPDMRRLDQAAWHDLKQAAARRWKKRRKHTPPIWGETKAKKAGRDAQATDANTKQTTARRTNRTRWTKVRDYLKNKTTRGRRFPGPGTAGPTTGPGAGAYGPQAGGSRGGRRSPFENAGQATGETVWTVTSEHVPGSQAKRWEPSAIGSGTPTLPSTGPAALAPAPGQYPTRPGTSAPKEPIAMPPAPVPAHRPDPRITRARNQAARAATAAVPTRMDAQHDTEITLDDSCDAAEQLMADGFKTHDQAAKLADRARDLRNAWLVLAEDCAVNSNLTGALYTAASVRFAESMELLARMTDEMRASSLEAAEMSETAGNELNDAYRPITQATADAGLSTPSAPVHNEV